MTAQPALCKCDITREPKISSSAPLSIRYCPLHAAAPETAAERDRLKKVNADLLEALVASVKWMTPVVEGFGIHNLPPSHPVHQARAAIAKAESWGE